MVIFKSSATTQKPATRATARQEYYFGGDIFYDTPANTGFGTPRWAGDDGDTSQLGNQKTMKYERHRM